MEDGLTAKYGEGGTSKAKLYVPSCLIIPGMSSPSASKRVVA